MIFLFINFFFSTKTNDATKNEGEEDSGENKQAQELAENIKDAIARGDIDIEILGKKVVVNFTPSDADDKDRPNLLKETLETIEAVKSASGQSEKDVIIGGLENQLALLAAAANKSGKNNAESDQGNDIGQSELRESAKNEAKKAQIAEDKLKIALRNEIGEGLVNVDREEDKVIITVGSAGAFKSGSAELTQKAREIMAKIAEQNKKGRSEILVMGHTDNVPLTFGSNYRDNWDLAAARAASVVQNLEESNKISSSRLIATSKGETQPIANNNSSAGRSKNRRIEIEMNYGK